MPRGLRGAALSELERIQLLVGREGCKGSHSLSTGRIKGPNLPTFKSFLV